MHHPEEPSDETVHPKSTRRSDDQDPTALRSVRTHRAVATLARAEATTRTSRIDTSTTEAAADAADAKESEATIRFDTAIQEELVAVGCHPGAADGVIGPQTDAAILAFQQADGIEADGELGPETESALKKAVAEGRTVCGENTRPPRRSRPPRRVGGHRCVHRLGAARRPARRGRVHRQLRLCRRLGRGDAQRRHDEVHPAVRRRQWVAPSQDPVAPPAPACRR